MINIPPIKSSTSVKAELIPDVTRTWKVGQILSATTERGGEALSKVLIRVGQHTLEAKTPVPLQTGQDVKLLVKTLADNQAMKLPLLSILAADIEPAGKTGTLATTKLRQFIAIQQSFSQLHTLAQNLFTNKSFNDKLPAAIKTELAHLLNTLPIKAESINSAQLKQLILNSGIFFESKLLSQIKNPESQFKNSSSLINDFKFQLLSIKSRLSQLIPTPAATQQNLTPETIQQITQLQTLIQQNNIHLTKNNAAELINKLVSILPKQSLAQISTLLASPIPHTQTADKIEALTQNLIQLIQQQSQPQKTQDNILDQLRFRLMLLDLGQQVDQSISKLTSLQLQPLSREGDNLVFILFNLIFKDSHQQFDVNFRIQQEDEKAGSEKDSWQISLTFNFKSLGKVQSNIHLVNDRVSTVFHTELNSTSEKIKPLLPLLESGLKNAGLTVINLAVTSGLLTEKPEINSRISLLDENA